MVEVQRTIIETFKVLAENEEDAKENYYNGDEVDWEQISNKIMKVELSEEYWNKIFEEGN